MKKTIVTTTINPPTKATLEFCKRRDFDFIIVGDLKTPHEDYKDLEKKFPQVKYLSPEEQEEKYKDLSDSIGWNCIQRRNLGFVHAYLEGYEIIASIDDDNIPYEDWGKNIMVGKEVECDLYSTDNIVFDPLSVTNHNYIWHRGFPIDLLDKRDLVEYKGKIKRKILVQADLWDGDPDIDAMARLTIKPIVKFENINSPYCSNVISPFNSQNTFLSREVMKYYMMLPFVGRMDDIWASYILQYHFSENLIYYKSTVYQERNKQDLIKNLENELLGYRKTMNFIEDLSNYWNNLPENTKNSFEIYQKYF
jgi:hypothetical protein